MQRTEITTKDFGPSPDRITVTMKTVIDHQGIAITTTAGGSYNSLLSRTFTHDQTQAARVFYGHIRDCATAGKSTWQIEAEVAALIEMEQAVDVEQIAEAINAEVDAHHAEVTAVHNQTVASVAEVMAGTAQTGGWYGARNTAQQTATPLRTVHPTRTRVHCKPPTPAELDLIRAHRGGVVTTRPGQSWTVLRAIERRGLGQPVYQPGTRIIASLRLNARGLALADVQAVAA
jgi:hypothetical protein